MQQTIIWLAALGLAAIIFIPYLRKFRRELREAAERKEEAHSLGIDRPRTQYPMVNRTRCIGCGACVAACPEGDVLGVVWGTAEVINGGRCVGHGYCEKACPVGALKVGLGEIKDRPDIPVLSDCNETTVPGLFIAGELGGLALIRHAISQGRMVMEEIARRVAASGERTELDLIIVGAGPAGISAALTAVQHRLSYLVLDEREIGGAILHYPRKKLAMTQPVELPLYGWLREEEYSKEHLMALWEEIRRKYALRIKTNCRVESVQPADGGFEISAGLETLRSRFVVLALGRRGTPRKMEVPGEELPKVLYQLVDAQSFRDTRVLVVGGGDSAVEAAIGLARQPGNVVSISYRKNSFFRVKKKNEDAVKKLIAQKKINALFDTQVKEVTPGAVILEGPSGPMEIPNDYVIVQIGGVPPYDLLRQSGVQFGGQSYSLPETDKRANLVMT